VHSRRASPQWHRSSPPRECYTLFAATGDVARAHARPANQREHRQRDSDDVVERCTERLHILIAGLSVERTMCRQAEDAATSMMRKPRLTRQNTAFFSFFIRRQHFHVTPEPAQNRFLFASLYVSVSVTPPFQSDALPFIRCVAGQRGLFAPETPFAQAIRTAAALPACSSSRPRRLRPLCCRRHAAEILPPRYADFHAAKTLREPRFLRRATTLTAFIQRR